WTTLRQLAALLGRARIAFGPDSGALHLAAAGGTPALSLSGPTSAGRSTPYGREGFAVGGGGPARPGFLRHRATGGARQSARAPAGAGGGAGRALGGGGGEPRGGGGGEMGARGGGRGSVRPPRG